MAVCALPPDTGLSTLLGQVGDEDWRIWPENSTLPTSDHSFSHGDSAKEGSNPNVMWEWLGSAGLFFLAVVHCPESPTFTGVSHRRDCWARPMGPVEQCTPWLTAPGLQSLCRGVFGFSSSTSEKGKREASFQWSGRTRIILKFQASPCFGS